MPIYRRAADDLVAAGLAYPCFCSQERLDALRAAAHAAGRPPRYDGRCRRARAGRGAGTPRRRRAGRAALRRAGRRRALRRRHPRADHDRLRAIGDFIILRSDGLPSYNFAAVVDDAAMAITHVIRGDDHLTNTARQELLRRALLPGAAGARLRPPRHDPGARRRQALKAPRGDGGGRVPRASATCPRRSSITWRCCRGRTATTRCSASSGSSPSFELSALSAQPGDLRHGQARLAEPPVDHGARATPSTSAWSRERLPAGTPAPAVRAPRRRLQAVARALRRRAPARRRRARTPRARRRDASALAAAAAPLDLFAELRRAAPAPYAHARAGARAARRVPPSGQGARLQPARAAHAAAPGADRPRARPRAALRARAPSRPARRWPASTGRLAATSDRHDRRRPTVIRLFNSLTQRKEELVPRDAGQGRHLRLRPHGLQPRAHRQRPALRRLRRAALLARPRAASTVTLVENITDVNDKINAKADAEGRSPQRGRRRVHPGLRRRHRPARRAAARRRAAGQRDDPRDRRPRLPAHRRRPRLRGAGQRLLSGAQLPRVRQALQAAHRRARRGGPRRGRAGQGGPARLRRLEGGQARRARAPLGEPLGHWAGPAGTSSARPWACATWAPASTSTAAAATSSSRTTRTRSPRPRRPACPSPASGCTTA